MHFYSYFVLLLVDFAWVDICFAKNRLGNICHYSTLFIELICFFVWDSASFYDFARWDFHSFHSELLYRLLTVEVILVASWLCCFLKSPSFNFNHMVSFFGIISSHWCWTLWFLLLNSYYYYYKFLGMMGRVASPSKFCISSTWKSPLQIFQSRNVVYLGLSQCYTREFYMSVPELAFSYYFISYFLFLLHYYQSSLSEGHTG